MNRLFCPLFLCSFITVDFLIYAIGVRATPPSHCLCALCPMYSTLITTWLLSALCSGGLTLPQPGSNQLPITPQLTARETWLHQAHVRRTACGLTLRHFLPCDPALPCPCLSLSRHPQATWVQFSCCLRIFLSGPRAS